jgi:hypothetical protein
LEVVDYILWETIKFDTPFSISNPITTCKNPNALPTPIRNHISKTIKCKKKMHDNVIKLLEKNPT